MIMKKLFSFLMLLIGFIGANTMNAQSGQMTDEEIARDIIGTWTEQFPICQGQYQVNSFYNQWVFNADGTLTIKSTAKGLKEKFIGYSVYIDVFQDYTPMKWKIGKGVINYTNIALKHISYKVSNPLLSEFNTQIQQKIKAAIPEYERKSMRATQLDWENSIGQETSYIIKNYSKNKMIVQRTFGNKEELVFIRNVKGYLDTKVTKKTGTLNGHDYVDLGLPSGTLWATCNVGAESYNQNGSYYVYGETMPKQNYTEDTYKFYLKQNGKYYLKKYCSSLKFTSSYDYVDGKGKLDPIDDVAHVKWGSDWRIPTEDELMELVSKCKWEKLNDGVVLTGPNGNSIFLPAAGFKDGTKHYGGICKGCYMSNANNTADPGVYCLNINSGKVQDSYIFKGYSVRPVNTSMVSEVKKKKEAEQAVKDQEYFQSLSPEMQQSVAKAKSMGIELVDLGLSVRWANMNLGARKPEDKGDRYAWGEVEPKQDQDFDERNYSGTTINGSRLDETSDPATIKIGAGFHVPSEGQWKELFEKCEIRESATRGGLIFTGPNGNSIFVPYYESDPKFYYWTCEGYEKPWDATAYDLHSPYGRNRKSLYRWGGNVIRPVFERNGGYSGDQIDKKSISNKGEGKIFDMVEEMPQFPGGPSALFEYLSKNVKYPDPVAAMENGIQGRVIVSFVVEKDGSISLVRILKSVEPSLDAEAMRVVRSMPKWTPGKQNGEPARVKYTLPVTFKLQ